MNDTSSSCAVPTYLSLCVTSKILLLLPAFSLNFFVLVSVVACLLSRCRKMRSNVAMFILGSTSCNLVNLSMWPMTIHWKQHGRWLLGSHLCEVMVSAKQLTGLASFQYVSLITFSIYLTVVWGCRRLVNSKVFLTVQLLFPLLPLVLKELIIWLLGSHVAHLDPIKLTCFSFINDKVMRVLLLVKTVVFLPLNLYFYGHILHTIVQSAKVLNRRGNMHLAKMFSLISLITFIAHVPGAVFALMNHPSVCQEMFRDLLLDLPLLSSPIILLCMNKELRKQCVGLLQRKPTRRYIEGGGGKSARYRSATRTSGETYTVKL